MSNTRLGVGGDTSPDSNVATDETVAATTTSPRSDEAAPLVRGDLVGRFVVLDALGAGGMGFVFSAYDPQLDRKVAIKLLRSTARADDASTRLLREAQAMAKISHPNVVKVHDVGTHGDAVYIAMELADGGTVRAWLGAKRSQREILDVFVAAGRGLAAAHAVGLVHRDFKPDNVLMGKDGSVRVTDFGLVSALHVEAVPDEPDAKVIAVSLSLSGNTPLSQDLTRTGAVMGTPTYMAGEQFEGRPATARTDQFAFCIALYEALYGERPFTGTTYTALAASVVLGTVLPPPRGSRVPAVTRRVLLRGLSRDPAARFPSMTELLAALTRVPARRMRTVLAVGLGAAILAGVLLFALRPSSATVCAAPDARVADVWNDVRRAAMKTAFTASGRPFAAAAFGKASEILDGWSTGWSHGYVEACEATRVRGDQSEHLLDLRMQCLTRQLDDTHATVDLLASGGGDAVDHAVEAVLGISRPSACADTEAVLADVSPPSDPAIATEVARVRARLDDARGERRLGRYAKALALAEPVLADARKTGYRPAIAEVLLFAGDLQASVGSPASIDRLRESMHVAAEAGDSALEIDASASLVRTLTGRIARYEVAQEVGDLADAMAVHAHPPAEVVVRLGASIGFLLDARQRPAEARTRYETTLAYAEKHLGSDDLAVLGTLVGLASAARHEGRYEDARKLIERVVEARERLAGKDHPDVATALNLLGSVYRAEGKLDDAKRVFDRALAIRIAALGPDHPDVGESYGQLGNVYSDKEERGAAMEAYQKSLAILERVYGSDSVHIAGALNQIGTELYSRGDLAGARAHYERSRGLLELAYGRDHPEVAAAISNLGQIAAKEDHLDEALADFQAALAITEKIYGPVHPDVADYLINIETAFNAKHQLDDAEAALTRAISVIAKTSGENHPRMGMALSNLGGLQKERNNPQRALVSYQRSLAVLEAAFGKDHPYVSSPLLGIGWAQIALKHPADAVPILERALAIRTKGEMSPSDMAEVQLQLAEALYATGARARAVMLGQAALASSIAAKEADGQAEARQWLARHR